MCAEQSELYLNVLFLFKGTFEITKKACYSFSTSCLILEFILMELSAILDFPGYACYVTSRITRHLVIIDKQRLERIRNSFLSALSYPALSKSTVAH